MSVSSKTIAANTTFYTAALTIQKILSFTYFSYLARSLGSELTGKYFFVLSLAAIVMVFMDVGLTPVLTREASKHDDKAQSLLSNILGLKMLYMSIVAIATFFLVPYFIVEDVARHLVYIALAIAAFDSFSLIFFASIRAKQNLFYESIASILFQVITLTLGSFAIAKGYDIRIIIMALFIASFVNMMISMIVLNKKFGVRPTIRFERETVKKIFMIAIPFALAMSFVKVQAYVDTVMLKFFMGDGPVGIYSVAYKLTFAFQFIPLAFVAALYPAFSKYWHSDKSQLKKTFTKAYEYLLIISLPIVLGISAIAHDIIPFIYTSEYTASIVPLIVLLLGLPMLFVNFPVGALLNACSRQTRQMWHLGITMIVSVVLNLILIPFYGPIGAAMASSISTVLMFTLGIFVAVKIAKVQVSALAVVTGKILLVGILMFIAVIVVNAYAPWILAVLVGAIVYPAALYAFKIVTPAEISFVRSIIKR